MKKRYSMTNISSSKPQQMWRRYKKYFYENPELQFGLDISRMNFTDDFLKTLEPQLQNAYNDMAALENGAIANPDEHRMVGHYWLRAPELAPNGEGAEIEKTIRDIKQFAAQIHDGSIAPQQARQWKNILVIGIGGSALGPQFVARALGQPRSDKLKPYFFDNTDSDGMERTLAQIGKDLKRTLVVVISKSGGTKETRNGMMEAQAAFHEADLDFGRHAVAITGAGSTLDQVAKNERWLARFPMWDWVGGRTSELSAVGLLPAALQGFDIDAMLQGAAQMDIATRSRETLKNPAALLAAMWFHATNGRGEKDMVILPYKDRLELFSRYLQQLVMESLGKEKDLRGKVVHQGIAVYGNKGSTDQHAYVQQLREGINNFFVTFIEVLKMRTGEILEVEPGVTAGDYLSGFLYGTRDALWENGRESMTITIGEVSAFSVGVLIALYERAVGFYASLVNINAYHQPGVEAGKKAAQSIIALQAQVLQHLQNHTGAAFSAQEIADSLKAAPESVYHILRHLAANNRVNVFSGTGPETIYKR
jgi:glucose-6-phosphate isomerase